MLSAPGGANYLCLNYKKLKVRQGSPVDLAETLREINPTSPFAQSLAKSSDRPTPEQSVLLDGPVIDSPAINTLIWEASEPNCRDIKEYVEE